MFYACVAVTCVLVGAVKVLEWYRPNLNEFTSLLSYVVAFGGCFSALILSAQERDDTAQPTSKPTKSISQNVLNYFYPSRSFESAPKLESIGEFMDEISKLHEDSTGHLFLLRELLESLRANKISLASAISEQLPQTILLTAAKLNPQDKRYSMTFEILNFIFHSYDFDTDDRTQAFSTDIAPLLSDAIQCLRIEQDNTLDLSDVNDDGDVINIAEEEDKKELRRREAETAIEISQSYKAFITVGLLASKSAKAQGWLGDRGVVEIIIGVLSSCKESVVITKWCLWTLVHLTFKHPPNKRDYFVKNGLPATLSGISRHNDNLEIVLQGFALIYSVLSYESQGKYNLYNAKTQALANGIIDIVHYTQKKFKSNKELMATVQAIQEEIFKDWS